MKIADMHCDTISEIWESRRSGRPQQLSRNSLHMDIRRMKEAGYLLQDLALYTDLKKCPDPFAHVMQLADVFDEEMEENRDDIRPVATYEEILENRAQGKISALMTIEEGACCKGDIRNLEALYSRGARMMTLTWNYPNELAHPNILGKEKDAAGFPVFDGTQGLTAKGFSFIERMEELGMIIDVSHLSDAGFWDVAQHTKRPFVASHSNARSLCGHPRNLTDEMIRKIADRGGVIGLNYYGCFLNSAPDSRSSVARMARHARHILDTGGRECLGLGSDFDGIDGELEIQDCSQMYKLVAELERQHFTGGEIDDILYRNVMKVYREML